MAEAAGRALDEQPGRARGIKPTGNSAGQFWRGHIDAHRVRGEETRGEGEWRGESGWKSESDKERGGAGIIEPQGGELGVDLSLGLPGLLQSLA